MARGIELGFQDNALGSGTGTREKDEQDLVLRANVQEVLEMPGWAILHKLMMAKVGSAQNMLNAFSSSLEQIRYYQGVVDALVGVRQQFIDLGKEEGDE